MERVTWGHLSNSLRVEWIARMRTRNTPGSSGVKQTHAGLLAPGRPQLRTVLETVLTWLCPPQNSTSAFLNKGHFHRDRSFSVWR